jgi:menaquinol-cytochrome c reductase iron-sulfur subunit
VQSSHPHDSSTDRRSFLKRATYGLAALFGALLGIPALAYLIDPRNRPAPDSDFKTVARLSDLSIGKPQQVVIHDISRDAWTLHPNDVIGRVWLIRRSENQVDAFTTICPHLGCSVNFEEKEKLFLCPCHGGTFNLQGQRVETPGRTNPAPRGMDRLECRLDPPGFIQVKYQNFIQGKETPIPKT